jgi:hypothetical protein
VEKRLPGHREAIDQLLLVTAHSFGVLIMRFRDPDVIPILANAILATLKLPASHSTDMDRYRRKVLNCQCRELEKFLRLRKSVAAQKIADERGIGDLSAYTWLDQTKTGKMGDAGRETFHFEHTVPVSSLLNQLLALSLPTPEAIANIIAKAEVSWITKKEDERLTALKFRHKRDDPAAAYHAADIVLCDE